MKCLGIVKIVLLPVIHFFLDTDMFRSK